MIALKFTFSQTLLHHAFTGIPSEAEFIRLLFQVLSQSRFKVSPKESTTQGDFLPNILFVPSVHDLNLIIFAAQYSIQYQFGRLVLHLLQSKEKSYVLWILTQLGMNVPLIADFTSNEEFITRLLVYTAQLVGTDPRIRDETWKVSLDRLKIDLGSYSQIQQVFLEEHVCGDAEYDQRSRFDTISGNTVVVMTLATCIG